jgi:hypothetical protein
MKRVRNPSDSSLSRWLCLVVGVLWGLAALLVVLRLHVNPNNLRDVHGQPVFRTVYARDPGLWVANFVGIGTAIVLAAVELAVRTQRKSKGPGVVAIALGALLCLYSLFGLLYGIAAVAPIGVMLIVSGRGMARRRVTAEVR